jgi:hypothetical protein
MMSPHALRTYTGKVIAVLVVVSFTLALLAMLACGSATAPGHIVVTCEPVYLPVLTPTDTLWHKTTETRCTWLDTTTGQGGAGRGPTS